MKNKKILSIVLIAIIILMSSVNFVYADSVSVKLTSDKQNYAPGQTVEITVALNNIVSDKGIYGLKGKLEYDTDKFETITASATGITESMIALSGWGNLVYNSSSGEFAVSTPSPAKTSQSIMRITLKVKEGATLGAAKVELTNLQASDSLNDIDPDDVSITVNIKDPSEVDGGNIPPITSPSPTATPTTSPSTNPTKIPATATAPTGGNNGGNNLPKTGIQDYATPLLFGALIISLVAYIAYRRYKEF